MEIVGADVTPHAHFRTGIANEHDRARHPWCPCDGVTSRVVDERGHLPEQLAGFRIERPEVAVKRASIKTAAIDGDAAIDCVTTCPSSHLTGDLRIVSPH